MRGIVLDINFQGYGGYLLHLFRAANLEDVWDEYRMPMYSIFDLGFRKNSPDREIWNRCQKEEYLLITDNRNDDGEDSLSRVIEESLQKNSLPVVTIGNKGRFHNDRAYALVVAEELLELIIDINSGLIQNTGRAYLPKKAV